MNGILRLPHQISQPPQHPGMPLGRAGSLPQAFNLMRARAGMGQDPSGGHGGMFPGLHAGFGLRRGRQTPRFP